MSNTNKIIVIVLIAVIALVLLGGAGMMMRLGGYGMGPGMMYGGGMMGGNGMMNGAGYGYSHNPFGMLLPLLSCLLILGGIALLVYLFVRSTKVSSTTNGTPLDILKMRYAKGEITKEQFDTMKQDLGA
jgi:putative membrane protein